MHLVGEVTAGVLLGVHVVVRLNITIDAALADVEVALLAEVELVEVLEAEVALAFGVEVGEAEGVFVVASGQGNRSALEAVILAILLAENTLELDDLGPVALAALVVVVLGASDVDQHVVYLALHHHWPLLLRRHPLAVPEALPAQPPPAPLVVVVGAARPPAPHAPALRLPPHPLGVARHLHQLRLVVHPAGVVVLHVHYLAAQAVAAFAGGALARTLPRLGAEGAGGCLVVDVAEGQLLSAGALGVDIGDDLPGFGGVEFVRQFGVAALADAEVAEVVVVDPVVADGSADAAHIADEIQIGDALEVEGVADGTALLRAGRHAAPHAVEVVADAAEGAAQFLLLAAHAVRFQHFLVGTDEELQLVSLRALVVRLQLLLPQLLPRDEGAAAVVVVELLQGGDGQTALRGIVGAVELDQQVRQWLHQERRAALERTLV